MKETGKHHHHRSINDFTGSGPHRRNEDDEEQGRVTFQDTNDNDATINGTQPQQHVKSMRITSSKDIISQERSGSQSLGGKETKAVSFLRLVVLAVLVVSATSTAIAVYYFTRNTELRSFQSSYLADAENIIQSVGKSLYVTLGAIDSYTLHSVSQAHDTNQQFPFVTIADTHVHLAKLGSIGRNVFMQQAHFVKSQQQRMEWENYTSYNNQWINDAIQLQQNDINYIPFPVDSIHNISNLKAEKSIHNYNGPSSGDGPFLPTWQSYPIVSGTSFYNFDALTFARVIKSYDELFGPLPHVIISQPSVHDATNNLPVPFKNDTQSTQNERNNDPFGRNSSSHEPFSVIIYPIVDHYQPMTSNSKNSSQLAVGVLSVYFYWKDLITDILPPESDGIYCVISNTCNSTVTYEINGPAVRFVGMSDLHDPAFTHMVRSLDVRTLKNYTQNGRTYTGLPLGDKTCPYTINIYPSGITEDRHKTSNPAIFTVSAVLIFLFTSAVFLVYDLCVEKRQQKVMNTAIQSSENVSLLESMVRERTRKLEETNRSLAEANRRVTRASAAQLEHFACMSHEIRTPLNCIIGLSSLLLDTELNAMQEESMRMIVTSGDLLLTVVNDVLDYSKLESGNVELNITRSNLQDTLSAVVQSIEARARPKMLSINTVYDPRICEYGVMDCRRLQQILYNLLGNALKFSNAGGTIDLNVSLMHSLEISTADVPGHTYVPKSDDHEVVRTRSIVVVEDVSANPRDSASSRRSSKYKLHYNRSQGGHDCVPTHIQCDHYICFVVRDCGKGIERKDFQKIFEPFRQASAETERVYGGTGLGLAVTAKLVTALGGHVSVDSCEGEWTEFTVQLPYRETPFRIDLVAQRLVNTVVLLVDDDPANVLSISDLFQQCGINFVVYKRMNDLASATLDFIRLQNTYICLVNEFLFDASAYNILAGQARSVLVTFGPKFSVKETKCHYRSLTQVLPSVLLTSFTTLVESFNTEESNSLEFNSQKQTPTPKVSNPVQSSIHFAKDTIRIMMAEDNKINQKVLLRILNRLGYDNVDIVDNGKEACDLEETQYYDIILMDVQMPVMSGIEACDIIMNRSSTNHPKPRIVFVTAHVSDAFETQCRLAGGTDFLPKPFNISDIQNCLQRNVATSIVKTS